MELRPYTPEVAPHIRAWLEARGMDASISDHLPALGMVAWQEAPIAAGFLRRCEGGFGMLDSFVTDPDQPPELRDQAMEMLLHALVQAGRDAGCRGLIAYCTDKNAIARTIRNGFSRSDFIILTKSLE